VALAAKGGGGSRPSAFDRWDGFNVDRIFRSPTVVLHDEPCNLNDGRTLLGREASGVSPAVKVHEEAVSNFAIRLKNSLAQPRWEKC
jgi:hypothetical protein